MFKKLFGFIASAEDQHTQELFAKMQQHFNTWAGEHNSTVPQQVLQVRTSELYSEHPGEQHSGYLRLIVGTSFWIVSARGHNRFVDLFRMPASSFPMLREAETPMNLKVRLRCKDGSWFIDQQLIVDADLETLLRALFKDMVLLSRKDFDNVPGKTGILLAADSFAGVVADLVQQKTVLAQKLVNRQEAIQTKVASDIHDVIIADLMSIRSVLKTDSPPLEEIDKILANVILTLREVCEDLTPRELRDWGLAIGLANFFDTFAQKNGLIADFDCRGIIPELPDEVQLHIFRIVQECCRNAERHAVAKSILLAVQASEDQLTVTIRDDGIGFDTTSNAKKAITIHSGGMGLSLIRERVVLLNCHYSSRITVDSAPGSGTKVVLTIDLNAQIAS